MWASDTSIWGISGLMIWADNSRSGSYVGRLWADGRFISFWQIDMGCWIWGGSWADIWADGDPRRSAGSGLLAGLISGVTAGVTSGLILPR